jgi:hypothetical protein
MSRASKRFLATALALLGAACSGSSAGISIAINGQFRDHGGNVDLAQAYPEPWDRVCVLGPYSDNAAAKAALGFDWDVDGNSVIHRNDGLALLLFVREQRVVAAVEHPRRSGDFSKQSGKCFSRERARFYQVQSPQRGGPGLFPRDLP